MPRHADFDLGKVSLDYRHCFVGVHSSDELLSLGCAPSVTTAGSCCCGSSNILTAPGEDCTHCVLVGNCHKRSRMRRIMRFG